MNTNIERELSNLGKMLERQQKEYNAAQTENMKLKTQNIMLTQTVNELTQAVNNLKKENCRLSALDKVIGKAEKGIYKYDDKVFMPYKMFNRMMLRLIDEEQAKLIEDVVFGENNVMVKWADEDVTNISVDKKDAGDKVKMLALAIAKKSFANNEDWYLSELKRICSESVKVKGE